MIEIAPSKTVFPQSDHYPEKPMPSHLLTLMQGSQLYDIAESRAGGLAAPFWGISKLG